MKREGEGEVVEPPQVPRGGRPPGLLQKMDVDAAMLVPDIKSRLRRLKETRRVQNEVDERRRK